MVQYAVVAVEQESRAAVGNNVGFMEMLEELRKPCTVGVKRNAKGHTQKWMGYKLHMDVADGGVPISGFVSSASLHDSQAARFHWLRYLNSGYATCMI